MPRMKTTLLDEEQFLATFAAPMRDVTIHGGVDRVAGISVEADRVVFMLIDRNIITVRRQLDDPKWSEFLAGLRNVFPSATVTEA